MHVCTLKGCSWCDAWRGGSMNEINAWRAMAMAPAGTRARGGGYHVAVTRPCKDKSEQEGSTARDHANRQQETASHREIPEPQPCCNPPGRPRTRTMHGKPWPCMESAVVPPRAANTRPARLQSFKLQCNATKFKWKKLHWPL